MDLIGNKKPILSVLIAILSLLIVLWLIIWICSVSAAEEAPRKRRVPEEEFQARVKQWFNGEFIYLGVLAPGREFRLVIMNERGISNNRANYSKSWSICERSGGRLAWIDSQAVYDQFKKSHEERENDIIHPIAVRLDCSASVRTYFIGAKAFGETDADWVWVDNAKATSGVRIADKWPGFSAYHSDFADAPGEECVYLWFSKDGNRYMQFGREPYAVTSCHFICEYLF